jgi:hypothetical protein
VIPGCSTVPGFVSLLAARWALRADVASLSAWLSMGSANPVSRGLVAGLLTPLGRKAPGGGRWFTKLVRAEISDGRRLRYAAWPAPYPRRGLRLGARRVPIRFYAGFDRLWVTAGLRLAAPLLGRLPRRSIPVLAAAALPFVRAASLFGTPLGVLLVRAEDERGAELDRIEVHARANGLDVPAAPVIWVVRSLLDGGLADGGLFGVEDVVPPSAAFAWLREAGYEVREGAA